MAKYSDPKKMKNMAIYWIIAGLILLAAAGVGIFFILYGIYAYGQAGKRGKRLFGRVKPPGNLQIHHMSLALEAARQNNFQYAATVGYKIFENNKKRATHEELIDIIAISSAFAINIGNEELFNFCYNELGLIIHLDNTEFYSLYAILEFIKGDNITGLQALKKRVLVQGMENMRRFGNIAHKIDQVPQEERMSFFLQEQYKVIYNN